MEEGGSVKIWTDLDNTSTGDSDSLDDCEEDDNGVGDESLPEMLNFLDAELLQDTLKESAICRDCKTSELELLEEKEKRSGQGQVWVS